MTVEMGEACMLPVFNVSETDHVYPLDHLPNGLLYSRRGNKVSVYGQAKREGHYRCRVQVRHSVWPYRKSEELLILIDVCGGEQA